MVSVRVSLSQRHSTYCAGFHYHVCCIAALNTLTKHKQFSLGTPQSLEYHGLKGSDALGAQLQCYVADTGYLMTTSAIIGQVWDSPCTGLHAPGPPYLIPGALHDFQGNGVDLVVHLHCSLFPTTDLYQ